MTVTGGTSRAGAAMGTHWSASRRGSCSQEAEAEVQGKSRNTRGGRREEAPRAGEVHGGCGEVAGREAVHRGEVQVGTRMNE